ncbi:hypothetical protein O3P69_020068 [Scylla paramamosain]|uniref:Secreted protein n=1 Tax=Scylla paramamosain TaxID=85552 RepID=A0AAW0TMM2_SCYPA
MVAVIVAWSSRGEGHRTPHMLTTTTTTTSLLPASQLASQPVLKVAEPSTAYSWKLVKITSRVFEHLPGT